VRTDRGDAVSTAVGIDFGTSASRVWVSDAQGLRPLVCRDGHHVIPSAVAFTLDGEAVVGRAAHGLAALYPERSVFAVHRLLGRKHHSPEIRWLAAASANEIVPAPNGDAWLRIGARVLSAQEVAACLLRHLLGEVEEVLGREAEQVVVAVPGNLDLAQRRAIVQACVVAGVADVRLLDAPAAAIIAGESQLAAAQRVVVLDVGAGYFDAALLVRADDRWRVQACSGDTMLGGNDVDHRLLDHLLVAVEKAAGGPVSLTPMATHRLREAAQAIKRSLITDPESGAVELPDLHDVAGARIDLRHPPISSATLAELMAEELESLYQPCAWLMEDAGIGTDDVDEIMLLGGGAALPAVRALFETLFRRAPVTPDGAAELLAQGAAMVAAAAAGSDVAAVSAHSIGVKVRGGRVSSVIARGQPLPCRADKQFVTAAKTSAATVFEIYQGEAALARDNLYVGRFALEGVSPGAPYHVCFDLDSSGLLTVAARAAGEAALRSLPIGFSGGLANDQLRAITQELAPESAQAAQQLNRLIDGNAVGSSSVPAVSSGPASGIALGGPGSSVAWTGQWSSESAAASDAPTVELTRPTQRPRRVTRASMGDGVPHVLPAHARPPVDPPRGAAAAAAPIEVAADSLVGSIIDGRYAIVSVLGEGGMGRVYLAEHRILAKRFAVKVLHPELATNERLAERFLREAQAAASIASEHVVEILDFGRLEDGTSYFVMEYLDGITLADLIAERGALPARVIRDVGAQIAEGLAAAHEMHIVHRDLKPENITLVRRKGQKYFSKILDFGIAKRPTSQGRGQLTMVGAIMGTPHYMAPEQIKGVSVDGRADIYALGVVLYEMATGMPPFDEQSVALLLLKQQSELPKPIREHPTGRRCPAELERIVLKCLAKEPDERYQSATEVAAVLSG